MIGKVVAKGNTFGTSFSEISSPTEDTKNTEQPNMPTLSSSQVKVSNGSIQVPPRSGFTISIPSDVLKNQNNTLSFTIKSSTENDITTEINENGGKPRLPEAGYIQFQDVRINNNQSETEIPESNTVTEKLEPITTDAVLFIRKADNTEEQIKLPSTITDKDGAQLNINIKDYPGIQSIVVRNRNTGTSYELSSISAFDSQTALGYEPKNAISTAGDAVIKYEGITITRPDNTIDDIVPNVTLHVYDKTEKTATISIKPDTETAKDALINFVGKYNQMVAEINILSQNKQEIIDELDYLSNDEKEEYTKNLGLFFNDMSLTSTKSRMQQIVSSPYKYSDEAVITMLSEIGISTNASGFGGYNPGKMRGYLEIDEKKLDENLRDNLDAIKSIFGYDSDGDLVIDSGIGYALDKQLTAYVQTGGILATKNSTLDRQIKASETKITKLESQLDEKEAQLRQKYGIMESTLNNLESQQGAIENFSKQNSNSK
jgi:flagellar hook-associated protein 2